MDGWSTLLVYMLSKAKPPNIPESSKLIPTFFDYYYNNIKTLKTPIVVIFESIHKMENLI